MMRGNTIAYALGWCAVLLFTTAGTGVAQETVFSIMKSDSRKAEELYREKKYRQAVRLYQSMKQRHPNAQYDLAIARAHYRLHDVNEAARSYESYLASGQDLSDTDLLWYAESLTAEGKYDLAVKYYTQYEKVSGSDPEVMKKIWQIKNREYLYEDSVHYTITPLSSNLTSSSDMLAVPYGSGYVFLSNRPQKAMIVNLDANDKPFFRWYQSAMKTDSTGITSHYGPAAKFFSQVAANYQLGTVSFFDHEQQMAYIASSREPQAQGRRPLQMFFAARDGEAWKVTSAFTFNNKDYSIASVSVREDGKVLYLSSDMPGGSGGLDIYRSDFDGTGWTKPRNVGADINTKGDESFPSVNGNTLYFASNGQPGLGGFDIFSAPITDQKFGEVQNMGYPVNTNFDDFGLILDTERSRGFLTSNRKGSDDVFEVTVDLQTYPFTIAGILKLKEENWRTADSLRTYPEATLELIDNLRGTVVAQAVCDASGHFNLDIPYFSQYRIKVIGKDDGDEAVVSLDLGKTRYGENLFELVVVKNSFKADY